MICQNSDLELHEKEYLSLKKVIRSTIKETWKAVLNVQDANDDDNFFEQGGTSVMAIQLVFLLSESTETTISELDFISHPTLKNLTFLVENS